MPYFDFMFDCYICISLTTSAFNSSKKVLYAFAKMFFHQIWLLQVLAFNLFDCQYSLVTFPIPTKIIVLLNMTAHDTVFTLFIQSWVSKFPWPVLNVRHLCWIRILLGRPNGWVLLFLVNYFDFNAETVLMLSVREKQLLNKVNIIWKSVMFFTLKNCQLTHLFVFIHYPSQ